MKDMDSAVRKIRDQYTTKDPTKFDELMALNAKVRRPAAVFGYVFGTIGAVIMGCGMSLVMTDLGSMLGIQNTMTSGIVIGSAGLLITLLSYPIYKKILASRSKKFADKIIALSDELIEN